MAPAPLSVANTGGPDRREWSLSLADLARQIAQLPLTATPTRVAQAGADRALIADLSGYVTGPPWAKVRVSST